MRRESVCSPKRVTVSPGSLITEGVYITWDTGASRQLKVPKATWVGMRHSAKVFTPQMSLIKSSFRRG